MRAIERRPYIPAGQDDWEQCYAITCENCAHQLRCDIVERMIETKDGGDWPEGGWITDPGAGVTCLSYEPRTPQTLPRPQRRRLLRAPESELPPVCGGCAARRGSEASVALHTQRDFRACVRRRAPFVCHETGELCGGWLRAMRRSA